MKFNRVLKLVNSFMESVTPDDQRQNLEQINDARAKKLAGTGNGIVLFRKGRDEEEQIFRVEIKFKKGSGDLTYNSRYVSRRFNQQDVPKRKESSKRGDVFIFVPD